MPESRLTRDNRTTVPARIRKALGLKTGTALRWHVMPDGTILIRAKTRSIRELAGVLHKPDTYVDIKDMSFGNDEDV
ncbi:AbrB/MazE/SpoVT family DNA-binding domain-containing protein [Caballeronia sp. LZ032]|uniref:AbrB/MazE/SpoVT family DNA-binding domain-containing protein n=1 Tax=Caballeronia sp. LZ032 TaxID=3038565 RepID=UPI0038D3EB14